jgi:hypothetical protein
MGAMTEQTPDTQHVLVVGPDGRPVGVVPAGQIPDGSGLPTGPVDDAEDGSSVADLVEQPAKVMRIGTMIKQLLDEVRQSPLDEAGRARLRDIHDRSIKELEAGLAPELVEELERLSLPFGDDTVPTEAELRIAQAQLVGWLEGLFHGIQTALFAQQMAARAQLEQMRQRALPAGFPGAQPPPSDQPQRPASGGPYL